MPNSKSTYLIVGGGLAGVSAIEGIRQLDAKASILLIGAEAEAPYDRPPLSKQLWTGGKKLDEIFVHPQAFYAQQGVELRLETVVTELDLTRHLVRDQSGGQFEYRKLLIATGGTPRRLTIPGGDLQGLNYYRTVDDYRHLRAAAVEGKSAVVIGGGFIGSEIAAALCMNDVSVTMIFPDRWLVERVFPESLGRALTEYYRSKGVAILTQDQAVSIEQGGERYLFQTRVGQQIWADLVIVGIGITPNVSLAQSAGLKTGNGIVVNEFLQTSDPDVYAAGDMAFFPEQVLGPRRIEHWDNAVSQGKHAGRNMAGANEPFTDLPFFFSDLFEFGYEAVGDVDSRHETFADWQEPNKTGVIYYLSDGRVRGAMMCNVWNKVDAARELIRKSQRLQFDDLRGAIR
ncbi:MAG TPA: FAD/NAD(P)-binding oxidoreductase [Tepidisphaeraceae bacterium]|nr:FAD/NAD(P)-binding oxidoreductase [Tepidisphaeraceae bacterium]